MKRFKIGILPRIILAILCGILLGQHVPQFVVRLFITFNTLFGNFLSFLVPFIIVGLVTPAIADMGKGAKRILLLTATLAYGSTLLAGSLSFWVGHTVFPHFVTPGSALENVTEATGLSPFFDIDIPPALNIMSALVLSLIVGLGLTTIQGNGLRQVANEFKDIIVNTINGVIIPMLPIYIFGIFLNMTYSGEVYHILTVFIQIIGIIFIMHIGWLLFQFSLAGTVAHQNPLKLLVKMLPAYFTALGTQSSAATIPVTLKQTKENGVRQEVAGFVIPLCATIHLSGSMLKIVACALALMILQSMPYDWYSFFGFICLLGITMMAAPGVPGGAIMAALGLLEQSLGFNQQDQALMIALYIAMDSFGTACNVTGDGAIAVIVDRWTATPHAAKD